MKDHLAAVVGKGHFRTHTFYCILCRSLTESSRVGITSENQQRGISPHHEPVRTCTPATAAKTAPEKTRALSGVEGLRSR